MDKWEYKILKKRQSVIGSENTNLEGWLNELGSDGWDVFDIVNCGGIRIELCVKRKING